ncbi:MAG: hypothetical protein SOT67_09405, partial [Bacteroidaceae bacterium]|nr:hypothetical protein [Bacteroidaceae bacterium]
GLYHLLQKLYFSDRVAKELKNLICKKRKVQKTTQTLGFSAIASQGELLPLAPTKPILNKFAYGI